MEAGDADMQKCGGAEAVKRSQHGNVKAWKPGYAETRKRGSAEAAKRSQHGNAEAWKLGMPKRENVEMLGQLGR
jgi:hypothetical protein